MFVRCHGRPALAPSSTIASTVTTISGVLEQVALREAIRFAQQ